MHDVIIGRMYSTILFRTSLLNTEPYIFEPNKETKMAKVIAVNRITFSFEHN